MIIKYLFQKLTFQQKKQIIKSKKFYIQNAFLISLTYLLSFVIKLLLKFVFPQLISGYFTFLITFIIFCILFYSATFRNFILKSNLYIFSIKYFLIFSEIGEKYENFYNKGNLIQLFLKTLIKVSIIMFIVFNLVDYSSYNVFELILSLFSINNKLNKVIFQSSLNKTISERIEFFETENEFKNHLLMGCGLMGNNLEKVKKNLNLSYIHKREMKKAAENVENTSKKIIKLIGESAKSSDDPTKSMNGHAVATALAAGVAFSFKNRELEWAEEKQKKELELAGENKKKNWNGLKKIKFTKAIIFQNLIIPPKRN